MFFKYPSGGGIRSRSLGMTQWKGLAMAGADAIAEKRHSVHSMCKRGTEKGHLG